MKFRALSYEQLLRIQINKLRSFSGILKYSLEYNTTLLKDENNITQYHSIDTLKSKMKQLLENKDKVGDENIIISPINSSWGFYLVYDKKAKQLLIEYKTGARPQLLFDVSLSAFNQSLVAPSWGKFYLNGGYRGENNYNNALQLIDIPNIGWKQMVDILSGKMSIQRALTRISRDVNPYSIFKRTRNKGRRTTSVIRQTKKGVSKGTKSATKDIIKFPR